VDHQEVAVVDSAVLPVVEEEVPVVALEAAEEVPVEVPEVEPEEAEAVPVVVEEVPEEAPVVVPRLSLNHTDTPVCSSLEVRKICWLLRTPPLVNPSTVKRESLLKNQLRKKALLQLKSNTVSGIHSDLNWLLV
jgi:hypothetical protein